jgi:hypothetical protein
VKVVLQKHFLELVVAAMFTTTFMAASLHLLMYAMYAENSCCMRV